ncbi:MAG: FAD-dependent oxidoreductase [Aquihabitans sp.]
MEDTLVTYFGEQARDSIHYIENDWCQEPWSGGAYGGRFTTGGWTTFGPTLKLPHGRIDFPGTETATRWNGYIDGAISAGERAAAEIFDDLDGGTITQQSMSRH